jgi:alkylated DNA repair dioxygenase AlkB
MPPERRKRKSGSERPKDSKPPLKPSKSQSIDDGNSLFKQVTSPSLEPYKISMPDAGVYYVPDLFARDLAESWYPELLALSTWYRPTLKVYGKSVIQSREIAAYATDPSLTLKYSGSFIDMHNDYPPVISSIQDLAEEKLGVQFNHVMLNRYDSGDVYIGLHSDNLENRVIATVSLGAERTFIMRHRTIKGNEGVKKWKLANGSLFVMQGDTQRFWKHEIPKEPKVKGGRISLTFRQLVY